MIRLIAPLLAACLALASTASAADDQAAQAQKQAQASVKEAQAAQQDVQAALKKYEDARRKAEVLTRKAYAEKQRAEQLAKAQAKAQAQASRKTAAKTPAKPETAKKPEAKKPEVKKPQAKKPEAKKPEAKKPVAKKPETKKPEAQKPEAKKPEAKKPAVARQAPPARPHASFEDVMGDPVKSGFLAIARIKAITARTQSTTMTQAALEKISKEAVSLSVRRAALFALAELDEKNGNAEKAADRLAQATKIPAEPKPQPKPAMGMMGMMQHGQMMQHGPMMGGGMMGRGQMDKPASPAAEKRPACPSENCPKMKDGKGPSPQGRMMPGPMHGQMMMRGRMHAHDGLDREQMRQRIREHIKEGLDYLAKRTAEYQSQRRELPRGEMDRQSRGQRDMERGRDPWISHHGRHESDAPQAGDDAKAQQARHIQQWLKDNPDMARRIFQDLRAGAAQPPAAHPERSKPPAPSAQPRGQTKPDQPDRQKLEQELKQLRRDLERLEKMEQ
ncbi:MAG: hypothetical protein ABFD92_16125 [Planctomycetaceae bacterium]